jgi:glycosyltransferase involved in cell wall biosynthesis
MKFVLMYDLLTELGGIEKLMSVHAKFLKEEGHEVRLLFGAVNPAMLKHFEGLQVEAYGKSVLKSLLGFNALKNIIKPDDIIISYSFPVNYAIRKFKNRKIQYMNHYPNFLYLPFKEKLIWANTPLRKIAVLASIFGGWFLRRLDRKLVKQNSIVFVNSYFTKSRLDPLYGIDGIISYPPVSDDFEPTFDKSILAKYNVKQFIFASGRIIPDKRFDWLIEIFSKIKDKAIPLLIAGQGEEEYKDELMQLAEKFGVADRVRFLGVIPREDLIALLSMAKVYVFPAPKEDFGLATAEAISCGTPCIVWGDGGGPTEQITDGVNGIHAIPYEIKDYSVQLEEAIETKWDKTKIVESSKKFSAEEVKKSFMEGICSVA